MMHAYMHARICQKFIGRVYVSLPQAGPAPSGDGPTTAVVELLRVRPPAGLGCRHPRYQNLDTSILNIAVARPYAVASDWRARLGVRLWGGGGEVLCHALFVTQH